MEILSGSISIFDEFGMGQTKQELISLEVNRKINNLLESQNRFTQYSLQNL